MQSWCSALLSTYTCMKKDLLTVKTDLLVNGTHHNTPQHTATHCNTLRHTATHCGTLQHTAHCNTLQQTQSDLRTVKTDLSMNAAINLLLALGKAGIYLLGYKPRIINGLRLYHRPAISRSVSLSAVVIHLFLSSYWPIYHCGQWYAGLFPSCCLPQELFTTTIDVLASVFLGYRPRIMNGLW